MKKTSLDWEIELLRPIGFKIMDPDGWNRTNYIHSFNEELITRKEFFQRVCMSTCCGDFKKLNDIMHSNIS